jgi:ESCRT-II complex subunit VPS36
LYEIEDEFLNYPSFITDFLYWFSLFLSRRCINTRYLIPRTQKFIPMEGTLWGNLLHPVQLTGSGRPILQAGEVECSTLDAVDLEVDENPVYPILKAGLAILTTHKIIWVDDKSRRAGAIPLASISQVFPPKKSIKNMLAKPRLRLQSWISSDGKISALGVTKGTGSVVFTLILRGQSLLDSFRGRLCELLRSRAWENDAQQVNLSKQPMAQMGSYADANSIVEGSGSSRLKTSMAGLSGILRKEQEEWEATDKSLQEAFQGLNALLSKAKEMVMLAEKMRVKLLAGSNAQSGGGNDMEMGSKQEMQDWLLSVGIASPVTKESAGALYHQQLSRQV